MFLSVSKVWKYLGFQEILTATQESLRGVPRPRFLLEGFTATLVCPLLLFLFLLLLILLLLVPVP